MKTNRVAPGFIEQELHPRYLFPTYSSEIGDANTFFQNRLTRGRSPAIVVLKTNKETKERDVEVFDSNPVHRSDCSNELANPIPPPVNFYNTLSEAEKDEYDDLCQDQWEREQEYEY
jgi:hypothetical protein